MTRESAVSLGRDIDFDGSAGGTKLLGLKVRPTGENQEFLLWVTLIGREKRSGQPIATFEVKKDQATLATATLRPDDSPDHFLVSTTHDGPDAVDFTLRARDAGGDAEMLAGTSLVVESPKADFTVVEKFSAREPIGLVGDLTAVWDPPNDCIRVTWRAAEHASYHMWRHDQGTGAWTDWERVDGDSAIILSPTRGVTYNIEVRGHRSEDDFGPTATADVDVPPASRQTSRTTSWTTSYLTWYTTRWRDPDTRTCRTIWHVTCGDTRVVPPPTCRTTWHVTCRDILPPPTCRTTWRTTCQDTTKTTTTCWATCSPVATVASRITSRVTRYQTTAGRDTTRQTSRITEPLPPEPERETTYDTTYFTGGTRQTSHTTTWTTTWTTTRTTCVTRCTEINTTAPTCWTIHYTTCWTPPTMQTCWTTRYTTCWRPPVSTMQTCWTIRYTTCWMTPGPTTSRKTCHTTRRVTSGTTRYLTS